MEIINKTVSNITDIAHSLSEGTQKRLDSLTKPRGSLGRLEEFAKQIVEITGNESPLLKNKVVITMASDHGVVKEGVSAFPQEVTAQMIYNFIRGGAGINVLARYAGAKVVVVDIGVACELDPSFKGIGRSIPAGLEPHPELVTKKISYGTKNMAEGPAMTRQEAIRSIEAGIEVFESEYEKGLQIVGTGDMGIGNTTASSAIAASITGYSANDLTGRGTGVNDKDFAKKIETVKKALKINKPDPRDALDVLSKVGGFEIGGLAGVILAAASKKVPIVLDGFISGAAAIIAFKLEPKVKEYMFAAHCSVEKGHRVILDYIGLKPLLDLNLRLGEGTGAVLGMLIIESGVKILAEMATFKSASVSEKIGE